MIFKTLGLGEEFLSEIPIFTDPEGKETPVKETEMGQLLRKTRLRSAASLMSRQYGDLRRKLGSDVTNAILGSSNRMETEKSLVTLTRAASVEGWRNTAWNKFKRD